MSDVFAPPLPSPDHSTKWAAIVAIAFSVAGIITAELLPVSLLTPMAADLGVTEGGAGQAVTATAFIAILASLSISRVSKSIDRRWLVIAFSILLVASNLLVAFASGYSLMMLGRVLLGISLGGFWAMSASLAMRLAVKEDVSKALAIIFGGVSLAMVVAAPVGSYFGQRIGWRGVFLGSAAMGVISVVWLLATLAPMPDSGRKGDSIWAVARRPGVGVAMVALFCVFAGQFAFFTYMRPFYEQVAGLSVNQFSSLLLAFGLANFIGTSLSSQVLRLNLKIPLAVAPMVMAGCAAVLVLMGDSFWPTAIATTVWGLVFGVVPVGWSTWVTRQLGDVAESAGGLQVAVIQMANTCGAAAGGLIYDTSGPKAPMVFGGALLVVNVALVLLSVNGGRGARKSALPRQEATEIPSTSRCSGSLAEGE